MKFDKLKTFFDKSAKVWASFNAKRDRIARKNMDESATKMPMVRSQFLGMTFVVGFVILSGQVCYVTLFRPVDIARTTAKAETMKSHPRADIVDRNGVLLASSLASPSLYADPEKIWDARETAQAIRSVFPELNERDLIDKLSSTKRFVWIKRRITPEQKQQIWALAQPGLAFEDETKRVYPMGTLAAHLIGSVNGEGVGNAGLEAGVEGLLTSGDTSKPVRLSIDSRVQYVVESELAQAAEKFHAIGGTAAIMDIRTGEMLAAASWPTMDSNRYNVADTNARVNHLISSVYEMGSTFKAFTFAVALEDKTISADSQFDTSKPLHIGAFSINDYHGQNRVLSAREVLAHSSNIGTALISREVGTDRLVAFFDSIGLLKRVSGEAMGARPLLPPRWGAIQSVTASYGHGIAVAPLAVIAAYAALANGGVYIRPTFLAKTGTEPTMGRRVISPETSHQIVALLRDVVTEGTGGGADSQYYQVAGKTGTAIKSSSSGYDYNRNVSSFAAVFPANAPQYSIIFLLDEPKLDGGASATAGIAVTPSVSKVVTRVAPMLGIAPNRVLASLEPSSNVLPPANTTYEPTNSVANNATKHIAMGAR